MDSEVDETAVKAEGSERIRRRTCVVCEHVEPVKYVTTFARNEQRQKEWIDILANDDVEFGESLVAKLANGRRKYLCLDHFDEKSIRSRKSFDGVELIRNSNPIAYKNATFLKHRHPEGLQNEAPPLPKKKKEKPAKKSKKMEKLSTEAVNGPMKILIDTVNFYVERMENEQIELSN